MLCLMTTSTKAATYFVVKYPYQADLKIFFVDNDYQAEWKNKEKIHMLLKYKHK